jgi:hypothetical protein
MAQDITTLFNKFAGKEVIDSDKDPVLKEMAKLAKANGFQLRVWFPDSAGTMDHRTDRINAHVEEDNGKYRISSNFSIG